MSKDCLHANSITSAGFINGFPFDDIETYSFQRGGKYNAVIQMLKPERHHLKERRNETSSTKTKKFD